MHFQILESDLERKRINQNQGGSLELGLGSLTTNAGLSVAHLAAGAKIRWS